MQHTGIIVFWNPAKGYGFVQAEGRDIFVHISETYRDLQLNERISFVPYSRTNGTAAGQVEILGN
jgi:cold shock CspA family protein